MINCFVSGPWIEQFNVFRGQARPCDEAWRSVPNLLVHKLLTSNIVIQPSHGNWKHPPPSPPPPKMHKTEVLSSIRSPIHANRSLREADRDTQRQFSGNICSEDDLRSRIFGTFAVKFLACLPLLGFSTFKKWYNCPFLTDFYPKKVT